MFRKDNFPFTIFLAVFKDYNYSYLSMKDLPARIMVYGNRGSNPKLNEI